MTISLPLLSTCRPSLSRALRVPSITSPLRSQTASRLRGSVSKRRRNRVASVSAEGVANQTTDKVDNGTEISVSPVAGVKATRSRAISRTVPAQRSLLAKRSCAPSGKAGSGVARRKDRTSPPLMRTLSLPESESDQSAPSAASRRSRSHRRLCERRRAAPQRTRRASRSDRMRSRMRSRRLNYPSPPPGGAGGIAYFWKIDR